MKIALILILIITALTASGQDTPSTRLVWVFGANKHIMEYTASFSVEPFQTKSIYIHALEIASGWKVKYAGEHAITPELEITGLWVWDQQLLRINVTNHSSHPQYMAAHKFKIELLENTQLQQTFALGPEMGIGDMLAAPDGTNGNATIFKTENYGWDWRPVLATGENAVRFILLFNDQEILAGTADHGKLFKSSDAGNSWRAISNFSNKVNVAWAADHLEHPDEPLTLIGTTKKVEGVFRGEIYQSLNRGETWSYLTTPMPESEYGIVSALLYVRGHQKSSWWVAGLSKSASRDARLVISSDSGKTWRAGRELIDQESIIALTRLPNGILLAGTSTKNTASPDAGGQIWRSGDEGVTWDFVYEATYSANKIIREFIPLPDGRVYALTQHADHVLFSDDSGNTWNTLLRIRDELPVEQQIPEAPIGASSFFTGSNSYRLMVGTGCGYKNSCDCIKDPVRRTECNACAELIDPSARATCESEYSTEMDSKPRLITVDVGSK